MKAFGNEPEHIEEAQAFYAARMRDDAPGEFLADNMTFCCQACEPGRVLLSSLRDGALGAEEFCRLFENFWNFELNEDDLPENLRGLLRTLFEEVVLFSPFPREEWGYPGYRDEIEIRQATEPVMKLMGISLLKEGRDE